MFIFLTIYKKGLKGLLKAFQANSFYYLLLPELEPELRVDELPEELPEELPDERLTDEPLLRVDVLPDDPEDLLGV